VGIRHWVIFCSLAAALIALLVLYTLTSLWWAWFSLPDRQAGLPIDQVVDSRFALDLRRAPSAAEDLFALPAAAGFVTREARLAVWEVGTQENDDRLVFLPRWHRLLAAKAAAQRQGWQVERSGLVLRAWQGTQRPAWPSLLQTAASTLRTLIRDSVRHPGALVALPAGTLPGMADPVMAVFWRGTDQLRVRITPTVPSESAGVDKLSSAAPQVDELSVALPGHSLGLLPPAYSAAWSKILHEKLHFSLTRPDILRYVSQFSQVALRVSGSEAGLGVYSAPEAFATAATNWVQEEERRQRPAQRAFRLPDGSLGYEKVPGEAISVWSEVVEDGCQTPLSGRTTLWLCRSDSAAALATSKAVAQQLLIAPPEAALNIGTHTLRQLLPETACSSPLVSLLCQAAWIRLTSAGDTTYIEAGLPQP
jgi:hypothetical protein